MKPIPYKKNYKIECQKIFDGNTPKFFDPSERASFVQFLEKPPCPYFVVVDENEQILGCGGYYVSADLAEAGLCWGMIDPKWHRQGIGTFLFQARLEKIKAHGAVKRVLMDTSQDSLGFYQRFGFDISKVTKDGYGAGLSRFDLVLRLQ